MAHDVVRLLSFDARFEHPVSALLNLVDQIYTVQYEAAGYLLASQVSAYILLYDNGGCHNTRLASSPCSSLASCSCGASEACAHQPHAHPALHHCCSAVPAPQSSQAEALSSAQSTLHIIPLALLASVFIARLVELSHVAERTMLRKPCCRMPAGLMQAVQGIAIHVAVVMHAGRLEQWAKPKAAQTGQTLPCMHDKSFALLVHAPGGGDLGSCNVLPVLLSCATRQQAPPGSLHFTSPKCHKAKM